MGLFLRSDLGASRRYSSLDYVSRISLYSGLRKDRSPATCPLSALSYQLHKTRSVLETTSNEDLRPLILVVDECDLASAHFIWNRPNRPLLTKETFKELHRAPNDGVRQLLAKLLARLAGVAQGPVLCDLFKSERHAHPR
jgi:hypothetical protein